MSYSEPSPFPPSFDGNPWAYGFGLFGDVVASALALAWLLTYLFEARRNRAIDRWVRNPLPRSSSNFSVLTIYRWKNIAILLFIVMRALPDAVWMLSWGEVSEASIRIMLALDLWLDGLAIVPFFIAAMCWAWGKQVIQQLLVESPATVEGRVPWKIIARNARIVIVVMVIAVGVTIGKAHA